MNKISAGILLYRVKNKLLEVLLVHPGGPFWKNKDQGAWTIPKGETNTDEQLLDTAIREFAEETGIPLTGNFIQLTPVKQKSGKWVHGWAIEKDIDETKIKSNSFELEWPIRSGKMQSFPEIDKACWYSIEEGKEKINPAQISMLEELRELLTERS
jgi:predicted NUDIX family NTP pyrophosphohydrolase